MNILIEPKLHKKKCAYKIIILDAIILHHWQNLKKKVFHAVQEAEFNFSITLCHIMAKVEEMVNGHFFKDENKTENCPNTSAS